MKRSNVVKIETSRILNSVATALLGSLLLASCNFPYGAATRVANESEGLGGEGSPGVFEATEAPSGLSYPVATLNLIQNTPMPPLSPTLLRGNQVSFSAMGLSSVPGLSVSTITGAIIGIPSVEVSGILVTINATNTLGITSTTLTINVAPGAGGGPSPTVGEFQNASFASAGSNNTIVIENGRTYVFGSNNSNNLNVSSSTRLQRAVEMDTSASYISGDASFNHGCMVDDRGGVTCFGRNRYGELGVSATGTSAELGETPVPGLAFGVDQVAVSMYFSCALKSNGGVWCWGKNGYGQLGIGGWGKYSGGVFTDENRDSPAAAFWGKATKIALGNYHVCALKDSASRTVICWGLNSRGQLGHNSSETKNNYAQTVRVSSSTILDDAIDVATGSLHSCAVTDEGSTHRVYCWGYNGQGQLGTGSRTNSNRARLVSGLPTGVTKVTAGFNHTCALDGALGDVYCWGDNGYGQLGNGSTADATRPVRVRGLDDQVLSITAGSYHTCARLAGGGVRCWGNSSHGALGIGSSSGAVREPVTPVKE